MACCESGRTMSLEVATRGLTLCVVFYHGLLSSNHQQYIVDDDDDDDLIPSIFPGRVWHLDQYELFCSETNRDNFILVGSEGELALCIQGSQLLVIHNGWVAESVSILTANHRVTGIWRQDSLLMLVRHQVRQNIASFSLDRRQGVRDKTLRTSIWFI
uniref:(California timema) hypothetical protein n=1 Tax=Timema californicum TaxID=61474 RepID=A0A7R9JLS0_TIMCA|nr:unnamed protein product [Timema californicum]